MLIFFIYWEASVFSPILSITIYQKTGQNTACGYTQQMSLWNRSYWHIKISYHFLSSQLPWHNPACSWKKSGCILCFLFKSTSSLPLHPTWCQTHGKKISEHAPTSEQHQLLQEIFVFNGGLRTSYPWYLRCKKVWIFVLTHRETLNYAHKYILNTNIQKGLKFSFLGERNKFRVVSKKQSEKCIPLWL